MTQNVRVRVGENKELELVLRDDGRVFHKDLSAVEDEPLALPEVRESKPSTLPFILFAIVQAEIIILFVLNVLEVI